MLLYDRKRVLEIAKKLNRNHKIIKKEIENISKRRTKQVAAAMS